MPSSSPRGRLLADLATRVSARLVLIVVRDADGLDPFVLAPPPGDALERAVAATGATLHRLGGSAFAVVAPRETRSLATTAQTVLLDVIGRGAAVHGEVVVPDDAATGERALAIALDRLRVRSHFQARSAERQVRDVLLTLLAERGRGTETSRVAAHAVAVGRRLAMDLAQLDVLVRAGELQDLGRLLIPDRILDKTDPLTDDEWAIVRRHPVVAHRILGASPALAGVAELVRASAERFDGTGYPDGLARGDIPLGARVLAVCVAFEAMTTDRPYRAALRQEDALGELWRCSGLQFDPRVVAAFGSVLVEQVEVAR